jgi:hypothetical protein
LLAKTKTPTQISPFDALHRRAIARDGTLARPAAIVLVIATSGAFGKIQAALNTIWNAPKHLDAQCRCIARAFSSRGPILVLPQMYYSAQAFPRGAESKKIGATRRETVEHAQRKIPTYRD